MWDLRLPQGAVPPCPGKALLGSQPQSDLEQPLGILQASQTFHIMGKESKTASEAEIL